MSVRLRAATPADNAELEVLIERSTRALLRPFLSCEQIAASLELMTLDHALIEDGTYFVAEDLGTLVACGGWGRRREYITPSVNGKPPCSLLEPPLDPARVRAMYTHPGHARRGLGRLILQTCERAARDAGFMHAELLATLAGEPLHLAHGCQEIERTALPTSIGVDVPAVRMGKRLVGGVSP